MFAVVFLIVVAALGAWVLLYLGRAVVAEARKSDPIRAFAIIGVAVFGVAWIAYIIAQA